MQQSNVAFYGPVKTAYWKECDLFIKAHASVVASIFNKTYYDTATIQKEASGLTASGIMLIDPTVFGEHFLASDYLLRTSAQKQSTTVLPSKFTNPLPESSNILTASKTILSPLPLPTATKARKRANTKQHSAILTATPLKADLENKEKKEKRKTVKRQQEN
ncbi:hypothetical protein ILUMI_19803 [Ignelater luminosus]|uniref:Uncharacterized protein n=1 Tax=Ignelater luminosus TaxID=2038154 RepID=A0A8K0CFH0_IGNLU|nr:hypothetical protein ILUMI_19803 [Ignelater luminosus]